MVFIPNRAPTFEAALRDVTAVSANARLAAAQRLASPPDGRHDEARQGLVRLLDDVILSVRRAAMMGIAHVGDDASLPIVLARFEDGEPGVREAAVIAAGCIGGDEALDAVRGALTSTHPEMRFQAVASLAEMSPDAARVELLRMLGDGDPEVRGHTASTLGELCEGADPGETGDALAQVLEDLDARPRREAALALARMGDARGERVLCEALGDPERAIEAALALGDVGGEPARTALADVAGRFFGSLHLKAAAGASLARLGDARGVPVLRSVLGAFRADGRSFAVQLVGEHRLAELAEDLAALVDRRRGVDPEVLAEALEALAPDSDAAAQSLKKLEKLR